MILNFHFHLTSHSLDMNPQRDIRARQSMSSALQGIRERLLDERARIEHALKNPSSVVLPTSFLRGGALSGRVDEIVDVPAVETKGARLPISTTNAR